MEGIEGTNGTGSSVTAQELLALLIAGCSGASMLQPRALECVLGRALAVLRSSLSGEQPHQSASIVRLVERGLTFRCCIYICSCSS